VGTAAGVVCLSFVVHREKVSFIHSPMASMSLPCASMGTTGLRGIGPGAAPIYGCPQFTGPTTDPTKIIYIEEQKQGRRAR
jgi:hypothetical protein